MNGSHVAAASGITGNIAAIGNHHWFPVDSGTAIAMASLIVTAFGASGVAVWNASTQDTTSTTVTDTEATKP